MKNILFCLMAASAVFFLRPLSAQDDDWEAARRGILEQFQQGREEQPRTYAKSVRDQAETCQPKIAARALCGGTFRGLARI
jgi:hypothetical protein